MKYRFPRLVKIFADGGYRGELVENVKKFCGWDLEITLRSDKAAGFEALPVRWVVERSFSWLENFRRLAKDYEYSTQMSETMVYPAFTTIMLHRIKIYINSNSFLERMIFLSDSGVQYAPEGFRTDIAGKIVQRMSRKANCWGNAAAEGLAGKSSIGLPIQRNCSKTDARANSNRRRRQSPLNDFFFSD